MLNQGWQIGPKVCQIGTKWDKTPRFVPFGAIWPTFEPNLVTMCWIDTKNVGVAAVNTVWPTYSTTEAILRQAGCRRLVSWRWHLSLTLLMDPQCCCYFLVCPCFSFCATRHQLTSAMWAESCRHVAPMCWRCGFHLPPLPPPVCYCWPLLLFTFVHSNIHS